MDRETGRRPAGGELPRRGVRGGGDRAEVRRAALGAGGGDARVAVLIDLHGGLEHLVDAHLGERRSRPCRAPSLQALEPL